jgi:hypothetical protein
MTVLSLTSKDLTLARSFYAWLQTDGLTEFTSDDFRRYGLDKRLVEHMTWLTEEEREKKLRYLIGAQFSRWFVAELMRKVGWKRSVIPSNHKREIRVYRWNKRP